MPTTRLPFASTLFSQPGYSASTRQAPLLLTPPKCQACTVNWAFREDVVNVSQMCCEKFLPWVMNRVVNRLVKGVVDVS